MPKSSKENVLGMIRVLKVSSVSRQRIMEEGDPSGSGMRSFRQGEGRERSERGAGGTPVAANQYPGVR